jgi:hypothetical protein
MNKAKDLQTVKDDKGAKIPKQCPKKPQIEVKLVKHIFSEEERDDLGLQLARAHSALVDIDGEFEQVKASFKSRIAEQQAIIGRASAVRMAGFEMRSARCRVVYRTKEGKKDYFLEFAGAKAKPVLTEDMTGADMQANLIPVEPSFEEREEIKLWSSLEDGPCVIVVGRLSPEACGKKSPMWFAAVDVRVGGQALAEKLDNGQPCATKRIDILRQAAKRLKTWLIGAVGKDAAKGFDDQIDKAIDCQKVREE